MTSQAEERWKVQGVEFGVSIDGIFKMWDIEGE
jgi:hypothetical protein